MTEIRQSVMRAAARMTPGRLRRRIRDVISAQVRLPSPPGGAHPEWSVTELTSDHGVWRLAVALPLGISPKDLTLVLVGRRSRREIALPMTFTSTRARADVPDPLLAKFSGDTVDLWIDPVLDNDVMGRRRVAASPRTPVNAQSKTGKFPIRWYTTVNQNVSVVPASARLDNHAVITPRLIEFSEDDAGARMTIAGVHARKGTAFKLLLVGRTTRREAVVDLEESGPSLTGRVEAEELEPFGRESVELFVSDVSAGEVRTRARIAVVIDLKSSAPPGSPRRWYVTADGHLENRRRTAVETITESGVFDEEYYRRQVRDLAADVDPIEHYVRVGARSGINPSAMFDTNYYRRMNPDVKGNPLEHYCEYGWRELRNPSPFFDTWWYWAKHLDLRSESTNPLAHYEAQGKLEGLSTRPPSMPSRHMRPSQPLPADRTIRRICLFAGYDADGLIDDYVVDFVSELSRHADVHYWADCDVLPSELEKLSGITVSARAERHGEYDFGSYSRLARSVGWDVIAEYDELLLINDSCYLLRPLDEVFETMNGRACDWWALQATKGIFQTRRHAVNQFRDPIPMESARGALVDAFERDYTYDFHLGSYFLAYRRPVLDDSEFRRYLDAVTAQSRKRNIVKKYEVGLTRWLIQHGHQFDTYISQIYPFHPLFSQWHFRMLDDGFPLFKRYLLSENHYNTPNLWNWKERILEKVPSAKVDVFERNLTRITEPEALERNLRIGRVDPQTHAAVVPSSLLSPADFIEADRTTPKDPNWWVFPVCAFSHQFTGNERAIFEEVKDDPTIRKIVLTRGRDIQVDGTNVEVVPLESPDGQYRLLRAGNILIKHSRGRNLIYPVSSELHNLIQVWHGIPFKRIGYASSDFLGKLDTITTDQAQYRAVISSSKIDTLAMTAAFYPLTYHQVWNTGLPRNDFIMRSEQDLPADLQEELQTLRTLVDGRRLVLFLPTFRNSQSQGYYRFTDEEVTWLGHWLRETGSVLGIREHMADEARAYSTQLQELPVLDLSDDRFPNVEVVYRASDALITDYSSAFIDYMLTGRPAVSFAYDYEAYQLERGGFYDLDLVFPGPIAKSFEELKTALDGLFERAPDPLYEHRRRIFFDHLDDKNSARVVQRIRDLSEIHGVGKWLGERLA